MMAQNGPLHNTRNRGCREWGGSNGAQWLDKLDRRELPCDRPEGAIDPSGDRSVMQCFGEVEEKFDRVLTDRGVKFY